MYNCQLYFALLKYYVIEYTITFTMWWIRFRIVIIYFTHFKHLFCVIDSNIHTLYIMYSKNNITHKQNECAWGNLYKKRYIALRKCYIHVLLRLSRWSYFTVPFMDFFTYYTAWEKALAERKDVNVLLLSYEEMKKVKENFIYDPFLH